MTRTRTTALFALAAGALSLSACSGSGVSIAAPSPDATAADSCAAMLARLDGGVAGLPRRDVKPASPYTAAWGDPAVKVRCGIPTLPPDSASSVIEVRGVEWRSRMSGDVVVWQAENRATGVEVRIPRSYDTQETVLADLGTAVSATVPAVPAPTHDAEPHGHATPHA